jgi:hypothetical protein
MMSKQKHQTTEKSTPLTKAEVEAHLKGKSEEINLRIAAIQGEVANVGTSIRQQIFSSPAFYLGGSLAAGLLFGLLIGGRRKRKDRFRKGNVAQALVEEYIDVIVSEARHLVADGKEPGRAVREALEGRVPVILYAPDGSRESSSKIGRILTFLVQTALGMGVNLAQDYVASRLDPAARPHTEE